MVLEGTEQRAMENVRRVHECIDLFMKGVDGEDVYNEIEFDEADDQLVIENFGEYFAQGQNEEELFENYQINEDEEESGVWEAEHQIDDDCEVA